MSELQTVLKSLTDDLKAVKSEIKSLKEKAPGQADAKRLFHIGKGESSLTSRPYSFCKAFGLYKGYLQPEEAKVEVELSNKLRDYYKEKGFKPYSSNSLMIPVWADAIEEDHQELRHECKSLVNGMGAVDPDEIRYLAKAIGYRKDLSWVSDTTGGTLVPLAQQGELIELLRNKEALIEAGAATFPLPPQGSISFPKQTGAMTANWLGEKTTISKSDIATGSLVLKAKKLAVRGSIPNELFRYSNPAADAIVRNDIARVIALKLDNTGLEGAASGTAPQGIINYSGINSLTATTVGNDGNTFQPQDWSKMVGKVEAVNGIVNEASCAFITRPLFYRAVDVRRADALSAADGAGTFVEFMKQVNPAYQKLKAGYKVVTSNQVSGARTKGSGTTLTYVIFGDWSQWLIGMGGVMEMDLNPWGDTPWQTDQTEIRGILECDMGPRHVESFCLCDTLVQG